MSTLTAGFVSSGKAAALKKKTDWIKARTKVGKQEESLSEE
jgi:hypothetical protein